MTESQSLPAACRQTPETWKRCEKLFAIPTLTGTGASLTIEQRENGYNVGECALGEPGKLCPFLVAYTSGINAQASLPEQKPSIQNIVFRHLQLLVAGAQRLLHARSVK